MPARTDRQMTSLLCVHSVQFVLRTHESSVPASRKTPISVEMSGKQCCVLQTRTTAVFVYENAEVPNVEGAAVFNHFAQICLLNTWLLSKTGHFLQRCLGIKSL
jgi:hypothetical protein